MKKVIYTISTIIIITSCKQITTSDSKNITMGEDTVAEMDIAISKLDQIAEITQEPEAEKLEQKLLFAAHGTEPGWFAQFYNNKLRLLVDYGKDSVLINDTFEKLDDAKGYTYSKAVSENGLKYALSVAIENVSCVSDASGDKEDRKVTVKYNNKTYKGCGSFVK